MESVGQGVFHLIYTAHESGADFQQIEPDLDRVASRRCNLVLVLEDALSNKAFCSHLEPPLRDLPSAVLFDPSTVKRNREELARAYGIAVGEADKAYRAWNASPWERTRQIFDGIRPFHRGLLAWAADHGVEIVREETSLEAWLTMAAWEPASRRTDAAAAKGDATALWAENRKEWDIVARGTRLRDADVYAQITRILMVERRGHDVVYVVGARHAVNEDLFVRDLNTVVYGKGILPPLAMKFAESLVHDTLDGLPTALAERFAAYAFLHERVTMVARPRASDNALRLIERIEQAAAAQNITLRQIVEQMIIFPGFQEAAGEIDGPKLAALIACAFLEQMIGAGFISQSEVEQYLPRSKSAESLRKTPASAVDRERSATDPTVRTTVVEYLDDEQCRQSFDVPGWPEITRFRAARSEESRTERPSVWQHVFVESPSLVKDEVTVVELHSLHGNALMHQLFAGRIDDHVRLYELVGERVGAAISDWRFFDVRVMRRQPNDEKPSQKAAESHADCRLFVAPTANAGVAVGTAGHRSGWLFDCFVRPDENENTIHDLLSLAIEHGAKKLVTYERPLLIEFFSRFGFQPFFVARFSDPKDVPAAWRAETFERETVPRSLLSFVYMTLVNLSASGLGDLSAPGDVVDFQPVPCARCGRSIVGRIRCGGSFGGYRCPYCGFISVSGMLTMPVAVSAFGVHP